MKKLLVVLVAVVVFASLLFTDVSASGGKVRGDEGAGSVSQHQVMNPPPFQP